MQLGEHVLRVGAHGVDAETELTGDAGAVQATHHAGEYVSLAGGEQSHQRLELAIAIALVPQVVQHRGEQARRDPGLATYHPAHRPQEVVEAAILADEAAYAGTDGASRHLRGVVCRGHNDASLRMAVEQSGSELEPV